VTSSTRVIELEFAAHGDRRVRGRRTAAADFRDCCLEQPEPARIDVLPAVPLEDRLRHAGKAANIDVVIAFDELVEDDRDTGLTADAREIRQPGRAMPLTTIRLDIREPGERADELVRAVASAFGIDWKGQDREGRATFRVNVAAPIARQRVRNILAQAGDPDGEVVQVIEPGRLTL
jgi:hypothetical protein